MSPSEDATHPDEHTPVLYQRVLSALKPETKTRFIDGTLGAGGHAAGILRASSPHGELLGLDRDPYALQLAKRNLALFGGRVHFRHASFAEIEAQVAELGWRSVHGVLFDLGLSSMQVENPERGFSFQREGPLDMRFDPTQHTTADDLVNRLSEGALADLLKRYGEEPRARRVARAIVESRPLHTTRDLAEVVSRVAPRPRSGIHPATRTFQALRIAVNGELEALEAGLRGALEVLAPEGRLVVIAFHSLEDRMVKRFFRRESRDCICPPEQPVCTCDHVARLHVLTSKPLRAEEAEIRANPRARSARMRVAEKRSLA